jgi:hypothetical protein
MMRAAVAKRRKARQLTPHQRRRFRTQRIFFTILAVVIIASFVISLVV